MTVPWVRSVFDGLESNLEKCRGFGIVGLLCGGVHEGRIGIVSREVVNTLPIMVNDQRSVDLY